MFSSPACELCGLRIEAEAAALSLLRHQIYGLPLGKEICSRPLGFSPLLMALVLLMLLKPRV
jgi:hypothetical protein